jgi:hypothetical protein
MEFTPLHYGFYHHTLPELFFERNDFWFEPRDPKTIFENLLHLWEDEVFENGDPDYDEETHGILAEKISVEQFSETEFFLLLELEKKPISTAPLFLAFVQVKEQRYYFTYEFMEDFSGEGKEEKYVFAAWTKDKVHENRGTHHDDSAEYFRKLVMSELKMTQS